MVTRGHSWSLVCTFRQDQIRIIEVLQSIRLMFKNVNHIYKYTAISNDTICLLYVINKRVAQLVFKIILRCEKLAWYTNLWITDFRTVVLSQNISFLNTTNLNSPLLMKQYSNDFKTFADKSNQSSHPYFVGQPSTNHVTRQY